MKHPILITGAAGFIGSNLARYFVNKNIKVNIIVKKSSNLWRLKDITKKNFKVIEKDGRKGDPSVLVADDTKARKLLKFKPKFKSLDEIIKTLIID